MLLTLMLWASLRRRISCPAPGHHCRRLFSHRLHNFKRALQSQTVFENGLDGLRGRFGNAIRCVLRTASLSKYEVHRVASFSGVVPHSLEWISDGHETVTFSSVSCLPNRHTHTFTGYCFTWNSVARLFCSEQGTMFWQWWRPIASTASTERGMRSCSLQSGPDAAGLLFGVFSADSAAFI